jgi:hypothetical protein
LFKGACERRCRIVGLGSQMGETGIRPQDIAMHMRGEMQAS